MDFSKIRNPNIALLERRRALKILHALRNAGTAQAAPAATQTQLPQTQAKSADDDSRPAPPVLRRL